MLGHRKMIKCASAKYYTVALLEISIDGCRIWPLAGKIRKKAVSGLEISIDGRRI